MSGYKFEDFKPEGNWQGRFQNLVLVLNGDKPRNIGAAEKAARWIEDYSGMALDREKLGLPPRNQER